MKKILKIFIVFLSMISLNSCSKLTVNGLRFLSRNVINDRDKFLKNIVYIHGLVETIAVSYTHLTLPTNREV